MVDGPPKRYNVRYYDEHYSMGLGIRRSNIKDFKRNLHMIKAGSMKGFNKAVEHAILASGEYFNLTSANG